MMDNYWSITAIFICWLLYCFIGVNGDVVDKVYMSGADAQLLCQVPGQHVPDDVYWAIDGGEFLTQNGDVLTGDGRISVDAMPQYNEWVLGIATLSVADAKVYVCSALENRNVVFEHKVNVIIGEPPRIKNHSAAVSAEEGSDVRLYCNATGIPLPTISWFKYDDRGGRQDLGKTGWELLLRDLEQQDEGQYECVANNSHKPVDLAQIDVDILFAPIIMLPYEQISQDVGKDTLLQCIITANPQGENYWQRDGRRLEDDDKYTLHTIDITRHQTMLGLGFALESDDFGEYTCVAENTIGGANSTMTVYEPYTGGPKVIAPPQDVIASPNRTVLLSCTVENLTPKDWLTWWWISPTNGTRRIFTSQHSSQDPTDGITTHPHKFQVVGHYDLRVIELAPGDQGSFVCEISKERNYTADVTIVDTVECSNNGSSIDEGEAVVLSCSLTYYGRATLWDVVWQHGDRKLSSINNDEPGLVSRLVTFPMQEEDEGVYYCDISSLQPIHRDGCSMRIDMIESEETSAGAVVDRAGTSGVVISILGCLVALLTIMFIVVLVLVVSYYRRELEKYRKKEEERPPSVRYRNGRLSVEMEGLTARDSNSDEGGGDPPSSPQEV